MYLEDGKLSAVPLVVGITTNGYLLTPEVASFLSQFINGGIQITLDGNKDRHNSVRFSTLGVDTYSVIVRNIKSCLKHGLNVCLRLNISEETDLNGKELLADFSDLNDTERELLIFFQYTRCGKLTTWCTKSLSGLSRKSGPVDFGLQVIIPSHRQYGARAMRIKRIIW